MATERADQQGGIRQHIAIALASLKRVFRLGETFTATLIGLATTIAAKETAYTYACLATGCWAGFKAGSMKC